MTFSASAVHALRATSWLAEHPGAEPVLGRDLAREIEVPPDYLAKVLGTLAKHGVLRATRGAKGGYRLARAPSRIRLLEIVEPFEGTRARTTCLLRPGKPCRPSTACAAHDSWSSVTEAYREFLENTTVEDIRERP
ncbi:MAG: Rrf2 family transcriptional regulator [Anaeromyxobacteraceae bacterium]